MSSSAFCLFSLASGLLQFTIMPLDDPTPSFGAAASAAAADRSGAASAKASYRFHNIIGSLCGFDYKSLVTEPDKGRHPWPTMQKYEKLEKIGEGKFHPLLLASVSVKTSVSIMASISQRLHG